MCRNLGFPGCQRADRRGRRSEQGPHDGGPRHAGSRGTARAPSRRARRHAERPCRRCSASTTSSCRHAGELVQLRDAVADIEANLPAVLNAISSMSGAARMVKRELDAFRAEFDERVTASLPGRRHDRGCASPRSRRATSTSSVRCARTSRRWRWLMQRVETVRFEMLNELRYGQRPDGRTALEPRIVNPEALERSPVRLNIGAGHIPFEDYVNVDMRELPGIDVVADGRRPAVRAGHRRRDLQQPHAGALPPGGAPPPAAAVLGVAAEAGRRHRRRWRRTSRR